MITGTGQGIWTPETAFNQRSPIKIGFKFFHGFKMRRCAVAAWVGPFCVAGISHCRVSGLDLPEYGVYARFHHAVEGTATQVDRHHANFENPLPFRFCNWRIDYECRDLNNVAYQTCEGKTHTHCHITGGRDRYDQKLPGPGKACATLWVNGTRWRTHYHAILSS